MNYKAKFDPLYGACERKTLTLPAKLVRACEEFAAVEKRSLSNFVAYLMAQAVGGHDAPKPATDNGKMDEEDGFSTGSGQV